MILDLLSSRAIQLGLAFFVVVTTGSLFYNWHVRRTIEAELAMSNRLTQYSENQYKTRPTQETVDTNTVNSEEVEKPLEKDNTLAMSDEIAVSIDDKVESVGRTDMSLHDDFISEEELAEVPVSPFGFGPYPEVPAEYTARHGKTVWQYPGSLPQYNQRNIELIHRVMIALWNEGDTRFIGATLENGKIYVNYPNTMYVRYAVHKSPDGTVHRRITSWSAGEGTQAAIDQILVGEIPTGVTLIDMDSEDVGIDPYTFLGLE